MAIWLPIVFLTVLWYHNDKQGRGLARLRLDLFQAEGIRKAYGK
ncbi:MAG: hypothetical protein WCZ27_10725 [Tissierellaceae bacterium]